MTTPNKEDVLAIRQVLEKYKDKTDLGIALELVKAGFIRNV